MPKKGFKIYLKKLENPVPKFLGPKMGFLDPQQIQGLSTGTKYEKTLFFAFSTDIKSLKKKSLLWEFF